MKHPAGYYFLQSGPQEWEVFYQPNYVFGGDPGAINMQRVGKVRFKQLHTNYVSKTMYEGIRLRPQPIAKAHGVWS
jgi:hypothetical protein